MLQTATIRFLKDLSKNNNKPWFEENRKAYEAAKADFQQLITGVLEKISGKDEDLTALAPKDCLFRINRDVRFAKDKSPYKTNMGASMSRGGKKSPFAGYYLHLEPGKSFAGGGIWMPDPGEVKKIRQEIDYCYEEFRQIVTSKEFTSTYGDLNRDDDVALVNLPKGYEKDNPAAAYLKLKSWIAMKPLADKDLSSDTLTRDITKAFIVLQPMVKFINRALE